MEYGKDVIAVLLEASLASIIVWPWILYFSFSRKIDEMKRALVIISFMVGAGNDTDPPGTHEQIEEMNVILFSKKAA